MPRPASKPSPPDLNATFDDLKGILKRYAKPFLVKEGYVRGKRDYHLILKKQIVIDGRKKNEIWFASIIQQKHNVGFYFMPVYCNPAIHKQVSPALLEHLDGKSCFHMTELTSQLKKDIKAALKVGLADYKTRGWL